MADYRRARVAGGTFFFTVVTQDRQPLLVTETVRTALRDAIQQVRTTLPFHVEAWVLLPDHLHCVWTLPPGDTDFSARWAIVKRYVSRHCAALLDTGNTASRRSRNEYGFWQRRFWEHQIRNEDDLAKHVDYIHSNPVKHRLVQSVKDWPHSTFHRYVARGVYPANWGDAEMIGPDGEFGE